jgi:PilZ domain-containing protein
MGSQGDQIQHEEATVLDLSIRGCAIRTNAPLHKGDIVRLEIEMTPQQNLLQIDEAVVRTLTGRRFGLEFVNVRDEELIRLRTLLVELTHKR